MNQPIIKRFAPMVVLKKLAPDYEYTEQFDLNDDWVRVLITELETGIDDDDNKYPAAELTGSMKIKKHFNVEYKEHLTAHFKIVSKFHVPCIKCLAPTPQEVTLDFWACFLPDEFENNPDYDESTTIFIRQTAMELYFHHENEVNIQETLREQLMLHVPDLPVHNEECKGLCSTCGIDLNKKSCGHTN